MQLPAWEPRAYFNSPIAAAAVRRSSSAGKSEPILMWSSFQEAQQETFFKEQYLKKTYLSADLFAHLGTVEAGTTTPYGGWLAGGRYRSTPA